MFRPFAASLQRPTLSFLTLTIFLSFLLASLPAGAHPPAEPANPLYIQPRDRISRFIDDEQRSTLPGHRHPNALTRYDAAALAPNYRMVPLLLTLVPVSAPQ